MSRGVVATAFPAASEAGVEMLAAGGNAVDAAVAAAWALSVCEPSGSGLGGQTVMLIHRAGDEPVVLEGHSRAPAGASRRAVSRPAQRTGYRAATVPTTPATLEAARAKYGSLPTATVLAPAIRLAVDGYEITRLQHRQLAWCHSALAATEAGRRFLNGGAPYRPGERFRQPRLGRALQRLATAGVQDFYDGAIADAIARDMERHGGLVTRDDLRLLGAPRVRDAISIDYRGHRVATVPRPGGGVELLFGLGVLQELDGPDTAAWRESIALSTLAAFRRRESMPPNGSDGPEAEFGDEAVDAAARTRDERILVPAGVDAEEPGETTHLCTMDSDGLTVSLTQSIQSLFGAKVANDEFGFLYNNYLTTAPRRPHPYRLRSGGAVRSNAAPTLVMAPDGGWTVAAGAAGSRRIISSLIATISAVVDRGMDLAEAVAAPRVHARLSGRVWVEHGDGQKTLLRALARRGFTVEGQRRHSYKMGAVQAVIRQADGTMDGAADPRREGAVCHR